MRRSGIPLRRQGLHPGGIRDAASCLRAVHSTGESCILLRKVWQRLQLRVFCPSPQAWLPGLRGDEQFFCPQCDPEPWEKELDKIRLQAMEDFYR